MDDPRQGGLTHWGDRLPDGVRLEKEANSKFLLSVSLPTGEDHMSPLQCPVHAEHRFKLDIEDSEISELDKEADAEEIHLFCPYCGHEADSWTFMVQQTKVMMDAGEAAFEQYVDDTLDKTFRKAFGGHRQNSSGLFGLRMEYKSGPRPPRRQLKTFDVEETRRTMMCSSCGEMFGVYGLAIYCPTCGQFAPAQQFQELIRVQRERLALFDTLDDSMKRAVEESGVLVATRESTVKDGFTALETYLKNRFGLEAQGLAKPPSSTVFQRLDETNDLYKQYIGVDLASLAGSATWTALKRSAAIRHVLAHSAGMVDAKFLSVMPGWPQPLGQRIVIGSSEVESFLDALEDFALSVL